MLLEIHAKGSEGCRQIIAMFLKTFRFADAGQSMIIGNKIKSLVGLLHLDRGLDHAQIVSKMRSTGGFDPG